MKQINSLLFLFFFLFFFQNSQSQTFERFNFEVIQDGKTLKNPLTGGINSPQLSAVDLNNDGILDLHVFNRVGNVHLTFINEGTPNESSYVFAPEYIENFPVCVNWTMLRDYNKDGAYDLFTHGGTDGIDGIRVFNGKFTDGKLDFDRIEFNTSFNFNVLPFTQANGNQAQVFVFGIDYPDINDIDGDGDLDLFVGGRHSPWDYPAPTLSRLLRNDGDKFTDITKTNAPDLIFCGMVTDAVWTDYDNDKDFDLIIVGEWMPITILENTDGHFVHSSSFIVHRSTGWWNCIRAADIDGDGDDDYFVGNLGLNSKYKASETEPFEVHYADFDQNGRKDIVLSYYNFGEQFPLRGRSCSSEQIPILSRQFPTYDIFADADLKTVYGAENLEKALHYSVQSFASVFIENQGNEGFKITPLPNEAQISNINDFLIEDFDDDGHLDVLLAGNHYPVEIETPRHDSGIGLLLKGDSKGNWTPVSAEKSGISLPFDIKKIRKIRTANGDLYLFGVNDGRLQVLRKR